MRRRIATVLVLMMVGLLLFACGSGSDSDTDTDLVSVKTNELAIADPDSGATTYTYEEGKTNLADLLADGSLKPCFCQRLCFRAAQALEASPDFATRYPDGIPVAKMRIVTLWNTDGAEELFVEALGWAESDVRILFNATAHADLCIEDAVFYFIPENEETGWKVSGEAGLFPEDFFEKRAAAKKGGDAEKAAFKPVKEAAMQGLAAIPLNDMFRVKTVNLSEEGLEQTLASRGVLVIAHGSDEAGWNQAVDDAVRNVCLPYPVALGFLEFQEQDIAAAVRTLEDQNVREIIAVPLFISGSSNHIEEIRYVLGLRDTLPESGGHGGHGGEAEEDLIPVTSDAEIYLTHALDDDPVMARIICDHLREISLNPAEEIAVLVGHGSDSSHSEAAWQENFASLALQVKTMMGFGDVRYGFVAMGSPAVADVVAQAQSEGRVLVSPVMLSQGYFINVKIPRVLEGMDYTYADRALLPDPGITTFIENTIREFLDSDQLPDATSGTTVTSAAVKALPVRDQIPNAA
ncbi:sirohydrochlorin chelatase [Desulfonema ishimotonii]|uniref:sirohydrochlorin chelatase n=1 Tax=Desulfonema ishimotonii TaxID=45657 RepID=UPI00140AE6AC|nr:CbiX/SirB N-terminal domain-containing protein [Desulfonema ishimotonii]